ncbi:MAG: SpoIIE family protein phosphatase [Candidatus Zixiibacteriota bacterium]
MSDSIVHTRTEKLLLEAARVFNSTLEYEELIELVLRLVLKAVNSEAALVFRVDHDRTDMKVRFMHGRDGQMQVFYLDLGQGVVGWVAKYREPIILNDPHDPRVEPFISKIAGIEARSIISVPLIGKGQMIGVVEAINKADGPFTAADLDILTGLNNQIAVAIDNAHLYRDIKREALEKDLLYQVGKKLSGSLDLNEVLREIMASLKRVVAYQVGGVFLLDPAVNEIKSIYSVGYPEGYDDRLQLKIGHGLVGHVANTGETVIVSDVSKDNRYVDANPGTKSEIVVPIKLDDRLIGVINLESNELNVFDHRAQALISAFASQAAISIERARLHESSLAGKRLEEQLNIAREIQRSFLPQADPQAWVKGYDIAGRNVPSGEVGGDYYDFIRIVTNHTGIAIGDVSGKGIPAALIMASFRASLIAEIRNNYSIRTICQKVNSLLFESLESGNYVTAVYGVLDSRNHIFTFSNCGHNPPFVLRAIGEVEELREGGPILGVSSESVYEERAIVIQPGDVLVFYTDGVTEAFSEGGAEFGTSRLVDVIKANRHKSAQLMADAIYEAVTSFASPTHVFDDLTMIIIKRLG